MAEVKGTLKHGYQYGDQVLKVYVIREAKAGDIIEANEESEKLVIVPGADGKPEPMFVPSPTMVGVNVLRRQIVAIGPVSGPFDLDVIKTLHPEDLNQLQADAETLEAADESKAALEAVTERGRTDSGSDSV